MSAILLSGEWISHRSSFIMGYKKLPYESGNTILLLLRVDDLVDASDPEPLDKSARYDEADNLALGSDDTICLQAALIELISILFNLRVREGMDPCLLYSRRSPRSKA